VSAATAVTPSAEASPAQPPSAAVAPESTAADPAVGAGAAVTQPVSGSARAGSTSPQVAAVPPAAALQPVPLDSHALAARGLEKELTGDHEGAIADLRAALVAEPDPERRQGLRNLLQLLGAAQ